MSLSRKRQKELNHLRGHAEDLWEAQQAVLSRASEVAREARTQAGHLTREEVAPRVRDGYASYVRPNVDRGYDLGRRAANSAGEVLNKNILPAIGGALSVADVAKDARVQAAVKRLQSAKKVVEPKKSGPGFGTILGVVVGIVALAGIGYAVWQTFRADDELWVADDEPAVPEANAEQ